MSKQRYTSNVQKVDISEVKSAACAAGSYFFSKGAMRFFDSRLERKAYKFAGFYYFVTSEQFHPTCPGVIGQLTNEETARVERRYTNKVPREYTARRFNLETGHIGDLGDKQKFTSAKEAYAYIDTYLPKIHYIAMAGIHGCIPQYCDVYDSVSDAASGLALVHDLGTRRTSQLRREMYLELNLHRDGNEYCEIAECECDDPSIHSDE